MEAWSGGWGARSWELGDRSWEQMGYERRARGNELTESTGKTSEGPSGKSFSVSVFAVSVFLERSNRGMNVGKGFAQAVAKFPVRVVLLEFPDVADPPDVVADSIRLLVLPA